MVVEDERFVMRVQSTKDERVLLEVNKFQKSRPDKPCHKIRDSLFSSSNGNTDKTGLLNIFTLLTVLSAAHIALESIIKHGMLYDPVQFVKIFFSKPTESHSSLVLLGLNIFPLSSLAIEVLLSKGLLSENVGLTIIIALLTSGIVIPTIILYLSDCRVLAAFIVVFYAFIVLFKLVSYHMTNFWCRETHALTQDVHRRSASSGREKGIGKGNVETVLVHYPNNLNLKDLYYFLCAPTLCYELNFPRSPRVRKTFLVKRVLEMMFLILLMLFLVQQCIGPIMNDSLKPLQEMDFSRILLNVLKLAAPHMLTSSMVFYCCFHSYTNIVAEILRFGDRYFYEDFWNSEAIEDLWQDWNIPFHKWFLRHLYSPLQDCGCSNTQSSIVVFFLSAVFHEYMFIISLKILSFWIFTIMLVQGPLSFTVDKYFHNWYGNIYICINATIILPFVGLMYYHDYYASN